MIRLHGSNRHVCTCPAESFIPMIMHCLLHAQLGTPLSAHEFGKDTKNKVNNNDNTYDNYSITGIGRKVLLPCCGILSTGAKCNKLIHALDPALIVTLSNLFESQSALTSYLNMVKSTQVRLLREKHGNNVVVYCCDPTCAAATDGFITDELVRQAEGVTKHNVMRGLYVTCTTCNKRWCTQCGTDHPNARCTGPYQSHIKDLSQEDANNFIITHHSVQIVM